MKNLKKQQNYNNIETILEFKYSEKLKNLSKLIKLL